MLERFAKSGSRSVLRSSNRLPGGDRILLTMLTAYGTSRPGAWSGHSTKHALYFKFQFSRIIYANIIRKIRFKREKVKYVYALSY